jgi:hypothetical protein
MGRGKASKGFLKRDNDVAIMKMVNKKHIEDTEAQRKARVVKKTTKPDYVAPCLEEEPPPNKQLTFIESKFTQKVDYDKWVCEGAFGDQRSAETIADDMHASHEQVVSRKNMNARNEMDVLNETKRIFFAIVETQTLTDIFANFGFDDLLLLWDSAADAKTPKLVDSTKDLLSMDDDDFQTSVDSEDLHGQQIHHLAATVDPAEGSDHARRGPIRPPFSKRTNTHRMDWQLHKHHNLWLRGNDGGGVRPQTQGSVHGACEKRRHSICPLVKL